MILSETWLKATRVHPYPYNWHYFWQGDRNHVLPRGPCWLSVALICYNVEILPVCTLVLSGLVTYAIASSRIATFWPSCDSSPSEMSVMFKFLLLSVTSALLSLAYSLWLSDSYLCLSFLYLSSRQSILYLNSIVLDLIAKTENEFFVYEVNVFLFLMLPCSANVEGEERGLEIWQITGMNSLFDDYPAMQNYIWLENLL